MINGFKILWNDFSNLNRSKFNIKYIIPAFAAFLTFITIGSFCMTKLSITNLDKHIGKVNNIEIRVLYGYTSRKYPLWIQLDNYPDEFRLMDPYSRKFTPLQAEIKVGDEITIYHRNKLLSFLGTGKAYDIFQIEKSSKIILSFDEIKADYHRSLWFSSILTIILWTLYYVLHVIPKRKKVIVNS